MVNKASFSNRFLTPEERKRIEAAVIEAEKRTSGEIVTVVLGRSDSYPGARWRLAVAFYLLSALILMISIPDLNPIWYLWAQLPALGLGYALGSFTAFQRWFLSDEKMDEEVKQRALQAFYSMGLDATRGRTGVLILVSMLEHRVEILADQAIHQKVSKDTWIRVVDELVDRIREGQLGSGLQAAVLECGRILEDHFPGTHDDLDELRNHVVVLDS